MSAYVVSTDQIDAILALPMRKHGQRAFSYFHDGIWYPVNLDTAARVGSMLLHENMISVAYRYSEPKPAVPER
jgi:hypothetical protein